MHMFATAAIDSRVKMVLHRNPRDHENISIMFGNENVTLDFFDPESLERLRDLADEAARQLRAGTTASAAAES
jgi:hypothetical protein